MIGFRNLSGIHNTLLGILLLVYRLGRILKLISPRLFTLVLSFDRLGRLMLEVSVPVDKPPLKVPTYLPFWSKIWPFLLKNQVFGCFGPFLAKNTLLVVTN